VEFAAELQASLPEFTACGIVVVRENGGCVAPFSGMSWEVRGDGEKPLLHLWSEQLNLTRRALAITGHSEQRLALAVERFNRAKADRPAIIELKANEHIHLPASSGLLAPRSPAVAEWRDRPLWIFPEDALAAGGAARLVAPALRFHPTTDHLLHCLSPEMEVVCVGLAESWRRGIRVVMRQ